MADETTTPGSTQVKAIEAAFDAPFAQVNYLSHHSKTRGYIYMEVPKVACTTVKRILQDAEPSFRAPDGQRDVHDRALSPLRAPADDPAWYLASLRSPRTFTFAFVRNPYTRALSCYLDKFVQNEWERARLAPQLGLGDGMPTFLAYLTAIHAQEPSAREIHWTTQHALLRPDLVTYDYLGRFENFADHFTRICGHLGIAADDVSRGTAHATGAGNRIAHYFGPQETDLVRAIYAEDFRGFGYGYGLDLA